MTRIMSTQTQLMEKNVWTVGAPCLPNLCLKQKGEIIKKTIKLSAELSFSWCAECLQKQIGRVSVKREMCKLLLQWSKLWKHFPVLHCCKWSIKTLDLPQQTWYWECLNFHVYITGNAYNIGRDTRSAWFGLTLMYNMHYYTQCLTSQYYVLTFYLILLGG